MNICAAILHKPKEPFPPVRAKCILIVSFLTLLVGRFYLLLASNRFFEGIRGRRYLYEKAWFDQIRSGLECLLLYDWAVLLLSIILIALTIIYEVKTRYVSKGFISLLRTSHGIIALLLCVSFFSIAPYFSPGIPCRGDSIYHVFSSWFISESLWCLKPTLWTNFIWAGFPYGRIHGFLFSYLVAGFKAMTGDLFFSLKLTLAALHVLSGFFMYRLLQRLLKIKVAAFIGAVAYLLTYFRYHWILNMGRMRYEFFLMAFPLIWYFAERFAWTQGKKYFLCIALLFSSLILVQPGPYALHAFCFFLAFAGLDGLLGPCSTKNKIKVFFGLLGACLFSLLFTVWITIPNMIMYPGNVTRLFQHIMPLPPPSWSSLFEWTTNPKPNHYASYVGVSIFMLSIVGIFWSIVRRNIRGIAFSILYVFSLFLVFGSHCKLYSYIPFVYAQPGPGYFLLFSVFFLSIMSGYGMSLFAVLFRKVFFKIALLIFILILLDLAPLTFQDCFYDSLPGSRSMVYQALAAYQDKRERVVDLSQEETEFNALMIPVLTRFSVLNGNRFHHGEYEPMQKSYAPIKRLIYLLQEKTENSDKNVICFLRDALYLFNVRFLILEQKMANSLFLSVSSFAGNIYLGELPRAVPILASLRVVVGQAPFKESEFERIIYGLKLNSSRNTCEQIELSPSSAVPSELVYKSQEPLAVEVFHWVTWQNSFKAEFSINENAFIHIAQSYYPDTQVFLDGVLVRPVLETVLGFISVPVPKGNHQLEVRPGISRMQWFFIGVSVASFLGYLLYLFVPLILFGKTRQFFQK